VPTQPSSLADLHIRPVSRDDYQKWLLLWDGYNAFYGRVGATALPLEITRITWERFFDAYEPMHALVAETHGQLLGLAHYLYRRSTISISPNCYLQDLFTAESVRGCGIARALIEEVCAQAARAGSSRVYWHTHESNQTARLLYDKVAESTGFIVYRRML
jgi:GNAT superfamily N-acetyltransferase